MERKLEMDAPSPNVAAFATVEDDGLNQFLEGIIDEPDERVRRRGVPDNRARFREPRTGQELWDKNRDVFLQRGRIRSKMERFDYEKLSLSENGGQIRLLRIRKANKLDDPLICELCVKDLEQVNNKYEALSYCWGTGDPNRTIIIHPLVRTKTPGHFEFSPAQEFPVRLNLLRALQHLRSTRRGVLVWVDAICINQRLTPNATAEKNRQLSMMSNIYNSAKNVCIWLGDSDSASKAAFGLVKAITNFQGLDDRLRVVDQATDKATGEDWENLVLTLKATPWFSRRWIIQEIASARNASVHCGYDAVHWDDLAVAISLLEENCSRLEYQFRKPLFIEIPSLPAIQLVKALTKVCRKSRTGEISERLLDLETLVCTFQQFQASFPQDVIHSVRALAKDAPKHEEKEDFGLSVDTRKSTRDLFIAFVKRCIKQSGSLDIICRHWAPPVTDTAGKRIALPSWISSLSNRPFGLPGQFYERQNGENFVAITPGYKWKCYNASNGWKSSRLYDATQSYSDAVSDSPIGPRSDSFPREGSIKSSHAASHSREPSQSRRPGNDQTLLAPSHPPITNQPIDQAGHAAVLSSQGADSLPRKISKDLQISANGGDDLLYQLSRKRSATVPNIGEHVAGSRKSNPRIELLFKELMNGAMFPTKMKHQLQEQEHEEATQARARSRNGSVAHQELHVAVDQDVRTNIPELLDSTKVDPGSRKSSKAKQESWGQEDKEHRANLSGHLPVDGMKLGTVLECSDLMRDGIIPGDWLEKLGWSNTPMNLVPDQLWRTLVADRTANGSDPPEWYKRACLHCLKDSRLVNSKGDLNSHKSVIDGGLDSMSSIFLKRVESVIWRRRIIKLQLDSPQRPGAVFGLAPEKAAAGDIVCILAGCSVPVVMKKFPETESSDSNKDVFKLVGEAFVHENMDGEAVPDIDMANRHKTSFVLQ